MTTREPEPAAERPRPDAAFFQVPVGEWADVDPATRALLADLSRDLAGVVEALASGPDTAPGFGPATLALRFGEVAGQLFGAVAGAEGDLRQVIATMRTALALCWDMYSADETGHVTVRQHMDRLRSSIAEFESDLQTLQQSGPPEEDAGL